MSQNSLNAVLRQGAAEYADFFSICIQLRHLPNVIINAGFLRIQSARAGMAEEVRARDFPHISKLIQYATLC